MTFLSYNQLTDEQQADLLWQQGRFLSFWHSDDYSFVLYALGSFFVEVVACNRTNTIDELHSFCRTALLQPYLKNIQLIDLYG